MPPLPAMVRSYRLPWGVAQASAWPSPASETSQASAGAPSRLGRKVTEAMSPRVRVGWFRTGDSAHSL